MPRAPFYHLIPLTTNRKLGPMAASYSSNTTCPPACPLAKQGCYALYGPISISWSKVTAGLRGGLWAQFVAALRLLPRGSLFRYGVAGDLPGQGNRLNITQLRELVRALTGRRGFAYTHKPMWRKAERDAVKAANDAGFTINLSADTLSASDTKKAWEIGPVVVTVKSFQAMPTHTPAGHRLVACPQQTHNISCSQCQLCLVPQRKSIVAFAAHGTGARYVGEE
jgi:hypothetical protein